MNDIVKYIQDRVYQPDLKKTIDEAFEKFGYDRALREATEQTIIKSVLLGLGVLPSIEALPMGAGENILDKAWTGDGLNLSKRIRRTNAAVRKAVYEEIREGLKRGEYADKIAERLGRLVRRGGPVQPDMVHSMVGELLSTTDSEQLAKKLREFDAYAASLSERGYDASRLGNSYRRLVNAIASGSEKRISSAVDWAVRNKTRFTAERIALTESMRAYHEGFIGKTKWDSDVVAYKWKLSSGHKIYDICDVHAEVDTYGLGPGVYPKNSVPRLPAHPYCKCYLSEVFEGEITAEPKPEVNKGVTKFLRGLDRGEQEALLGKRGAKDFRRSGDLSSLRGWSGHSNPRTRLTREQAEQTT